MDHLKAVSDRLSNGVKLNNGSSGSSKDVKSVKKSSIKTKSVKTVNYIGQSVLLKL